MSRALPNKRPNLTGAFDRLNPLARQLDQLADRTWRYIYAITHGAKSVFTLS
jgi:hypothetical protein